MDQQVTEIPEHLLQYEHAYWLERVAEQDAARSTDRVVLGYPATRALEMQRQAQEQWMAEQQPRLSWSEFEDMRVAELARRARAAKRGNRNGSE